VKLDMDRLRERSPFARVHRAVEAGPRDGEGLPRPDHLLRRDDPHGAGGRPPRTQQAIDYYKGPARRTRAEGPGWGGGRRRGVLQDLLGRDARVGRLRQHSELFANLKSTVLASTYCSSWIFPSFDGNDPIRSMAKAYLELSFVRSDRYKEQYIKGISRSSAIDGIIYHDAKTCPTTRTAGTASPDGWRPTPGSPPWSSPATSRPSPHLRRADENQHRSVHRADRGGR